MGAGWVEAKIGRRKEAVSCSMKDTDSGVGKLFLKPQLSSLFLCDFGQSTKLL